jgi:glycosyltransferase involved in cell wall biosynthesis
MRIALYHNLPSGGAKRSVYEHVRGLSSRHTIDLYSLDSANHHYCDLRPFVEKCTIYSLGEYYDFKSPFGRLNQLQRWRRLVSLDALSKKIAADIDRRQYDVVYVHPCIWTQAPAILKYLKTPSVYFIHEPPRKYYEPEIPRPYIPHGLRKTIDRWDPFLKLFRSKLLSMDRQSSLSASHLLTNSYFTAGNIQRIYHRPAKVLYFGVDHELFRRIPGIEKGKFLLSVGAIQPHKGFDFLIEALGHIPGEIRPALHLVGNADDQFERDYLTQAARENGVELTIETQITDEGLVQKYNQAVLVGYSPVQEPFGFVPLEAMACETPVVGVAEGGVCETIIDGVTGRLVKRDPLEFAGVIQSLLRDPRTLQEMGRKGRERVFDSWTWENSVNNFETFLRSIC